MKPQPKPSTSDSLKAIMPNDARWKNHVIGSDDPFPASTLNASDMPPDERSAFIADGHAKQTRWLNESRTIRKNHKKKPIPLPQTSPKKER